MREKGRSRENLLIEEERESSSEKEGKKIRNEPKENSPYQKKPAAARDAA